MIDDENGSEIKNYTKEVEDLFLQFFMTDPELFVLCIGLVDEKHFNNVDNKKAIMFIKDYAEKYAGMPTSEQIQSVIGITINPLEECGDSEREWFLNEYETFARHKALQNAIFDAPDLLDEHRYGEVESMIKEAVAVGLVKDLGLAYYEDPLCRLEEIANSRGATPSGMNVIDDKLYGGHNRGEVSIYAGQSGSGKSIFLQNYAVNWSRAGLNVIYISLELNENLCAMRIDAMNTEYGTRDVLKNRTDVDLKIRTISKANCGKLQIKQMKNGCTANDIKAYVKEYEIQSGVKVDAILLDYLDLCMPTNAKISAENLFVKDKYVTENMRDLAGELDILFVTASQLNRSSHEEHSDFSHANIAGGLSKINTADNVMAIFQSPTMRENGRYQIQFMKTRSSSGVGSKVDLGFNVKTLRIYDLSEDELSSLQTNTQGILARIQAPSEAADEDEGGGDEMEQVASNAMESATKLADIMNRLKK